MRFYLSHKPYLLEKVWSAFLGSSPGKKNIKSFMSDQQKNNCSLSGFITLCISLVPQGWQLPNHPNPTQSQVKTIKALNKDPKGKNNQYGFSLLLDRWLRWFFLSKRAFSIYCFFAWSLLPYVQRFHRSDSPFDSWILKTSAFKFGLRFLVAVL